MKNLVKFRSATFRDSSAKNSDSVRYEVHQLRDGRFVVASVIGLPTRWERALAFLQRFRRERDGRPSSLPRSAMTLATADTAAEAIQYVVTFETSMLSASGMGGFSYDMGTTEDGAYCGVKHYSALVDQGIFGDMKFPQQLAAAAHMSAMQAGLRCFAGEPKGSYVRAQHVASMYRERADW